MYFEYQAKQSFRDAADGTRIFCLRGPLSRPYIVRDSQTEQRLLMKLIWVRRISLGILVIQIVGQPFLFGLIPSLAQSPLWILGYLVLLILVYLTVEQTLLHQELKELNRMQNRLTLRQFYEPTIQRYHYFSLILMFFGNILFVISGIWMLITEKDPFPASMAILFFGIGATVSVYITILKVKLRGE